MKRRDDRGSLYLVTAFVLGVIVGLVYGWAIEPLQYSDTDPGALRADFKDHYRVLIARAFLSNQDIGRAVGRLKLLNDVDSVVALTLQAQRAIAESRPEKEVQALTYLMLALSQGEAPIQLPTLANQAQEATPSVTSTSTTTPTPFLTATPLIESGEGLATGIVTGTASSTAGVIPTPTATPGAALSLYEQTLICDTPQETPMLQIEALDTESNPISGVTIRIQRAGDAHEELFYTGLKPEIGLGYADFAMFPDTDYLLWVGEGGPPVEVKPPACEVASGKSTWGTWKLTFIHP
ncbi:MAG: hypothetical protein ACOYYS_03695 [Chloroflexota bacterium]